MEPHKMSIDEIEKLINAGKCIHMDPDGTVRELTAAEIAECEADQQGAEQKVADQKRKPILCLDFDGVIHSYGSGWKGADHIPDPPVDGAMRFIWDASDHFRIAIYSSRSGQSGGIRAMKMWLTDHFRTYWAADRTHCDDVLAEIEWPTEKPAAMVTIDDRALTFTGTWPSIETLKEFQPWNKRPFGATGEFPQGKLNDTDEGALRLGVAYDKLDGIVRVDFGKPVAWLGLPPPEAIQFAKLLLKNAGVRKVTLDI